MGELVAPIVSFLALRRSALFGGSSGHPFSEVAKSCSWQKPLNSADVSPRMCSNRFRSLTSLRFAMGILCQCAIFSLCEVCREAWLHGGTKHYPSPGNSIVEELA